MEKGPLKKHREMLNDSLVEPWMAGYKTSSKYSYLAGLAQFMDHFKMTPAQLLVERKADLKKEDEYERRRFERLLVDFNRESLKKGKPGATKNIIKAVRSFFAHHYVKLEFQLQQKRELSEASKPVYVDYLPTREDLKAMVEVADVRDRAMLLTGASTGIGGDICEFTREQLKQGLARRASPHDPVCMAPRGGYLKRLKTNVRMRPFLTCDAVNAIKLYLQTRKDDSPWLFVDRSGRKLTTDALNKMVMRVFGKTMIDLPEGQRMRLHNFRDFYSEAAHDADIPHDWICVLYGREVSGSENFYVHASEDKLREKFKRVEPRLSISRISNMVLLRKQHEVALDDQMKATLEMIKRAVGEEDFRRMAEFEVASKRIIKWDPETEYEPADYRKQRILNEMLNEIAVTSSRLKEHVAPRERERGA